MFRPVRTRKVYEEIVDQIKQLIIDGKLQPGDKLLSERELSEKLNVSRASVREAFSALEMMGVITIRPGEGSFVRQVSFQGMLEPLSFFMQLETNDIMYLLEVRKIIESETAALAAVRATPQDLGAIHRALNEMLEEVAAGGLGDVGDTAFHFAVARAANNPVINQLMSTIADLMKGTYRATRQKLFLVQDMTRVIHNQHLEIYNAIANNDPYLARMKMKEHLVRVEENTLHIKNDNITLHVKNQ